MFSCLMGYSAKGSDPSPSVPMVIKEIKEDEVERGLIDDLKNLSNFKFQPKSDTVTGSVGNTEALQQQNAGVKRPAEGRPGWFPRSREPVSSTLPCRSQVGSHCSNHLKQFCQYTQTFLRGLQGIKRVSQVAVRRTLPGPRKVLSRTAD